MKGMENTLLNQRYTLDQEIGRGGQATTYLATDEKTASAVVVKALRLDDVSDWKGLELFERESRTLRSLSHPKIPGYIDDFQIDDGESRSYYLVQHFVDGQTLTPAHVRDADEVTKLIDDVLEILIYLQDFSPPVVHRDIKPDNLVIDQAGAPHLVDFGAVQIVKPRDVGGSTIVGTSGYVAPEQLMGMSSPASDLYGLGATAVYLLTGQSPSEFETRDLKIQWRDEVRLNAPSGLLDFVDALVEPHAEDRIQTAREARESLKRPGSGSGTWTAPSTQLATTGAESFEEKRATNLSAAQKIMPAKTTFRVVEKGDKLIVERPVELARMHAATIVVALAFISLFVFQIERSPPLVAFFVFLHVCLGGWGAANYVHEKRDGGSLHLSHDGFVAQRHPIVGDAVQVRGSLNEFAGVVSGEKFGEVYIETRDGLVLLGTSVSQAEADWIKGTVSAFVQKKGLE